MRKAVVLLSGGLDSATTLAIAKQGGYICHALSLAYGQRHSAELAAAMRVAEVLGAAEHKTLALDLSVIGGSALTDARIAVPKQASAGIPSTYSTTVLNSIFFKDAPVDLKLKEFADAVKKDIADMTN